MTEEEMRKIIESSSEITQIIANHYFELKQCGFNDEQALQLTIAYQHAIMSMGNNE